MKFKRIQLSTLCAVICIAASYGRAPEKIIGGTYAARRDCPQVVGVRTPADTVCAGSVLGKMHILTAAHCVKNDGVLRWDFQIITNTHNWFHRENNVFGVYKALIHKDFKYGLHNNRYNFADIAVLKLDREIPLKSLPNLQRIRLPSNGSQTDEDVEVCGWGKTTEASVDPSTWLKKLEAKTISLSECQRLLPDQVDTGNICTVSDLGEGVCDGDSGAPLVRGGETIGIVSWGPDCSSGRPQVFTDVYRYRNWIQTAMAWNNETTATLYDRWLYL